MHRPAPSPSTLPDLLCPVPKREDESLKLLNRLRVLESTLLPDLIKDLHDRHARLVRHPLGLELAGGDAAGDFVCLPELPRGGNI